MDDDKIGKTRGLGYYDARDLGSEDYEDFREVFDSPCTVTGTLDFKYWAKKYPCLHCCFTLDNGTLIRCGSFRFEADFCQSEFGYGPRDKSIDFSEIGIEGKKFLLEFDISKKGNLFWKTARRI